MNRTLIDLALLSAEEDLVVGEDGKTLSHQNWTLTAQQEAILIHKKSMFNTPAMTIIAKEYQFKTDSAAYTITAKNDKLVAEKV